MGMAASQARFLGLTARQNNVEYEGQQVNQQRTALANESASLYAQLTNLTVPTPPDVTNYYKTEYSFKYNNTTYSLTSLPVMNADQKTYTLGLSYEKTVPAYKKLSSNSGIDFSNSVAGKLSEYSDLKAALKNQGSEVDDDTDVNVVTSNNNFYYQVNGATYQYFANQQTQNLISSKARITSNQSGDYETIIVPELEMEDAVSVSTTSVQDTDAYDLAMNAYRQEYSQYEKKMAEINAKTETIQQQDKTLELKLDQLDTEQQTLKTELESVTKLLDDNVKNIFNTFNSSG